MLLLIVFGVDVSQLKPLVKMLPSAALGKPQKKFFSYGRAIKRGVWGGGGKGPFHKVKKLYFHRQFSSRGGGG